MSRIRVLICDDHQIVREGLRALLAAEPDLDIAGEAADGEEAVRRCQALRPDVVLMDLSLSGAGPGGGLDGFTATERIRREWPEVRVVVLSMYDSPALVDRALRAGASGYVVKGRGIASLVEAIRRVLRGEVYRGDRLGDPPGMPAADTLSQRECEILALLCAGLSGPQIARQLGLQPKTIENHRARIMDKLGIHTTAGLVRYALQAGLAR